MIVREMINRLRVALDDEEQPYKNSTARLMQWLQGAYIDRQLQSTHWDFLHQRGQFIVTESGKAEYAGHAVKAVLPDSVYYISSGSNAKIPMQMKDYELWVTEQARGAEIAPSAPLFLIEQPDQSWRVEPTPNAVFRIYADRWYRPAEFANKDAEPLWESEYHEIVVLDAMKIAVALRPESPESAVMTQQIKERLPRMERAFKRRYLPAIGRAGAHV